MPFQLHGWLEGLSSTDFLQRGPGAWPLAGFQGCPLNFSSPRSRRERMKNLYLKGLEGPCKRSGIGGSNVL